MTVAEVTDLIGVIKRHRRAKRWEAECEAAHQARIQLAKLGQCEHEATDPWRCGSGPILEWRSACEYCDQVIKADHEPKDYTDWVYVTAEAIPLQPNRSLVSASTT